jgi:hypothetical protein
LSTSPRGKDFTLTFNVVSPDGAMPKGINEVYGNMIDIYVGCCYY